MAAGVEHAFCAKGLCNFGIVLGVAHHHAGSRGDAALCKPLFAHLHFAYAIDVCKAEQLSKIALQAPCGYLLDQVVPAGGGKHALPPAPARKFGQRFGSVCRGGTGIHTCVIMFHKALGQLRIGMSGKVEAGADVVFLNGKTENFPVSGKIVPLRITVGLQHPVETAVGEINIIHQSAVPVPEDHSVCLHGNLLAVIKLQKFCAGPCCSR